MESSRVPQWLRDVADVGGAVAFALLIGGFLVIVVNYMGVLPGSPSNWYLLGGLAAISGGFLTATRYR